MYDHHFMIPFFENVNDIIEIDLIIPSQMGCCQNAEFTRIYQVLPEFTWGYILV